MEILVKPLLFKKKNLSSNLLMMASVFYLISMSMIAYASYAMEPTNDTKKKQNKINIMANTLTYNNEHNFAEFSGKVRAVEENSVLTADTMKIYFNTEKKPTEEQGLNNQSIKRILANGNVELKFDDKLAISDRADYSLENNLLILTGDETKVTSGKNFITGKEIIIDRGTGNVTVKGNPQEPIQAEFFSDETGEGGIKNMPFNKLGS